MVISGQLYVDPESLNLKVERGHTVLRTVNHPSLELQTAFQENTLLILLVYTFLLKQRDLKINMKMVKMDFLTLQFLGTLLIFFKRFLITENLDCC